MGNLIGITLIGTFLLMIVAFGSLFFARRKGDAQIIENLTKENERLKSACNDCKRRNDFLEDFHVEREKSYLRKRKRK
jgi:hypothetical protein